MPGSSPGDAASERAALAEALFSPAAIALIGASSDATSLASRPERVLRRHGYRGSIIPVPRTQDKASGHRSYRAIADFPGRIDHAFILVPPTAAAAAVADCAAAGVKVATIFSGGFAELGASGRRRQDAIVATARAAGMRLLGPSSLGIVNTSAHVAISANAVLEHEVLRPGRLSLVSQSGSMLGAVVTRAHERGLGFSKLVSVGNECDLKVGEFVDLLVDDPDTQAILLFLEAFRDAPALAAAARRAFDAGKPVIALKLGRSPIGRELAAGHTGTLAGADEVADAFFHANGILRVSVFEALLETAQFVLGHRPPKGRRVGAVTVSGGGAAMVIDRLGLAGVGVVPPPAESIARLAAKRIRIPSAPLIDLPMGRADRGAYAAILDELAASDHCDVVLAVQGSNAAHVPDSIRERILAARRGAKPLAVFVAPRADEALRLLQDNAVAGFRTPEACADAICAYCDWRAPEPAAAADAAAVCAVRDAVRAASQRPLDDRAALALIGDLGIACAHGTVVRSGGEQVDLPFPVAAKILSPDIAHKTEVGGVELDIPTQQALGRAVDDMLARVHAALPAARIEGVLVQAMERGLAEVMIGLYRDAEIGPVVMVGLGGILAEVCGGHAVRLAPVGVEAAMEMIARVPALALIRGYRNRPRGHWKALAHAIHRISLLALASGPEILEAEINPLIVSARGVIAVDALVRFGPR